MYLLAVAVNFNPIIVLFLRPSTTVLVAECPVFQSYYSLIFKFFLAAAVMVLHFNPIIVLFLRWELQKSISKPYFNPIIVLFLRKSHLV